MGLTNIRRMTADPAVELLVYLEDFEDNWRYAQYTEFQISDRTDNYRLTCSGYSGTAGDSLSTHDGLPFTTRDRENTPRVSTYYPCGVNSRGAWWYGSCYHSNLNGEYMIGENSVYNGGINWFHWKGYFYSLKTTVMKIK